jgi:hypothetical protein
MQEIIQLRFSLSIECETTRNNLNRDVEIHILHTLYIMVDSNIVHSLTEARNKIYKNIKMCIKYGDRSIPERITANKGKREKCVVVPYVHYLVYLSVES